MASICPNIRAFLLVDEIWLAVRIIWKKNDIVWLGLNTTFKEKLKNKRHISLQALKSLEGPHFLQALKSLEGPHFLQTISRYGHTRNLWSLWCVHGGAPLHHHPQNLNFYNIIEFRSMPHLGRRTIQNKNSLELIGDDSLDPSSISSSASSASSLDSHVLVLCHWWVAE